MEKGIRFEMRLDRATVEKLDKLSQFKGKSRAAVVRELVNQAAATRQEQQVEPQKGRGS